MIQTGSIIRLDADAVAPVDPFPQQEARPCWRCYDSSIERAGKVWSAGVYWHDVKNKGDGPATLSDTWCCSPLHVQAMTANVEDGDHGRLLRYRSVSGSWKQWAMPMAMLAGDGAEVLGILLGEGMVLDRRGKVRVLDYINSQRPDQRLRAATVTGWHDGAFVLPDEVIGATDIWYQASERTAPYGTAGTLDGWRDMVAGRAVGNPLLTLGLSAAFAGVLLERLNIDGAGLHFFGDSSSGKTSILAASISVWGGPAFRRTWRTTSNGLEGAARMHTGTLLALDEVGEVSPRDLFEAAYALVNGYGKTRSNVRGEARQVSRWRIFVLSTGEVTIASRMAAGGFEAQAGQSLRLLDMPITGRYGVWDDLCGMESGAALSDTVRDGAAQHYGHAGRAFVRVLVQMQRDGIDLPVRLQALIRLFRSAGGQETRAARIFAVCALAGELATDAGIVPWQKGSATDAALVAFRAWNECRGARGRNAEDVAILGAVADFINRHGDSRFSDADNPDGPLVRDRAGYWRNEVGSRLYLFTSGGMREAIRGHDLNRALAALDTAGALVRRDPGKRSKKVRPAGGHPVSLYHIDPEKLSWDV